MLEHYFLFLNPSSLFSLPAFLLIYFCHLSSLASHVQYIRNKICSHISKAEHLSLCEERDRVGGWGGNIFPTKSGSTFASKMLRKSKAELSHML